MIRSEVKSVNRVTYRPILLPSRPVCSNSAPKITSRNQAKTLLTPADGKVPKLVSGLSAHLAPPSSRSV